MSNKYLIKYNICVFFTHAFPGIELLPAYAFYLGQRCLKGVSMCIARECVRVCVCKTMHIPPRSPVWAYQNGWSEEEEDGPPGERQYVLYIIYYICVCICVLKSFAARLHIICVIFRSIFSTPTLPPGTRATPSEPSPKATIACNNNNNNIACPRAYD